MSSLIETIFSSSKAMPEGSVLSPKEFLGPNSRAAVDQAFTRLTKAGKLIRVERGAYVVLVEGALATDHPLRKPSSSP